MNIMDLKSREISQMTGQRIGRLRKSSGLSLAALAQQTGLGEGYLERIENCTSEPSLRCVIRIANAFGVDLLFLVAGITPGTPHRETEEIYRR
jgi:transcriptional regulator with XRE-family HTH domain